MNNNEYSIIMTRIITLELLPQGNLDSSRGDTIYMYISDKLFIFVKFSWIKLAKFMIKQYHKCNCSKLIVNSLTNLCESPCRYLCWDMATLIVSPA
jgi:hypothetical protein